MRLAGIDRTTMKSVSVLVTTMKFDFLHRSVWLPPASSSADTTFEENIGQTFPTDLGDEGPFLGTIRAGRNRQGDQDGARVGRVEESAPKTGRPSILLRDQQSLFHPARNRLPRCPIFLSIIAKMRLLEGYPTGSSGPFGSHGRVYGLW